MNNALVSSILPDGVHNTVVCVLAAFFCGWSAQHCGGCVCVASVCKTLWRICLCSIGGMHCTFLWRCVCAIL